MIQLEELLQRLEKSRDFIDQVSWWEHIPAREGEYSDFPDDLAAPLMKALQTGNIGKLYTHQRECYDSVRRGNNTVVVTPTASGKTLCYNLPVIQTLMENRDARALYIFPTKALSQDQQSELNSLVTAGDLPVPVHTYDGDTPTSVRMAARNSGRIVISNPDMLHSGILPNHTKWINFISALKYVVIDEIHTYRGVFGSHMTNLIRRLKRITRFYGTEPVFICCSATIGNPGELTRQILESEVRLVDRNGAPAGEKDVILYNPPLVDRVQGIRRGVVLESRKIAAMVLKEKIKTIVFARSRVRTELIASYIRESLANFYTEDSRVRVESYRGGYLPGERRAIEKGLREGSIHGVVSTNALELGIDIGGLDVAVLAGIPGSAASAWQQAGRAGRRNSRSLAVMIASSSPVDQYMVKHPDYFFSRSPESAWVDPDNIYILLDHLKCAVFELPMEEGEPFGGDVGEHLAWLEESGIVRFSGGKWYWSDRGYPAEHISLRTATSENVVIVDTTQGRNSVIGEMDLPSAKELLFEGAVYIHRGNQYFVHELDLDDNRCYVEESEVNFYTDSIVKSDIKVLEEDESFPAESFTGKLGDILVRRQISKFKKLKYGTHENVGYGEIHLPEDEMHTRACILLFGPDTAPGRFLEGIREELRESVLFRSGNVLINVAPFFLLCDRRDLGVSERVRDPHYEVPAVYLYDKYTGGIGLAEGLKTKLGEIIEASIELVESCPCSSGCPSCIGPDSEIGDYVSGGSSPEDNVKKLVVDFLHECR